ncbi:hypothetical protein HG531_000921 [Fusarium graminearum]|nr:hypothetical protein HG531_000921 [Fusarium graminearum]
MKISFKISSVSHDEKEDAVFTNGQSLLAHLDVEAIKVHDLGPSSNEVLGELLLGISATVNFRNSTELGVRSEDKISACGSPLGGLGRTVGGSPELAALVLLGPLVGRGQKVDEEVVVGVESTETSDEDGHLRWGKSKETSTVDKNLLGASTSSSVSIVGEAIGEGLEVVELGDVGHLLSSIDTARGEGNDNVLKTGILGSLLNSGNTAENNKIGKGNLLGAGLGVELLLDALESRQDLLELLGVVAGPVDLRLESNAATVGTTTLVGSTEGRSGFPGSRNQLGNIETVGSENGSLEARNILVGDNISLALREGILPDELLLRDIGSEVSRSRSEITVEKLVPSLCEGLVHLLGVLEPALANLVVGVVVDEGEIRGEHGGAAELALDERIGVVNSAVECLPLVGASWRLDEGPLVAEKTLEEVVAPPEIYNFETTGLLVGAVALTNTVVPSETHLSKSMLCWSSRRYLLTSGNSTVSLSKGVSTDDKSSGLLIVHAHTAKGLTDIKGGSLGVGGTVRTLRVDVDQTEVSSTKRLLELVGTLVDVSAAVVADIVTLGDECSLGTPVDGLIGLPGVGTATGETKGLEV